jgi:hypothetical protein
MSMKHFARYADRLDALLEDVQWGKRVSGRQADIENSVNGEAATVLRKVVSLKRIRNSGAFFTGTDLAGRALAPVKQRRALLARPVYDPTCGAGDLLLTWADALPVSPDLSTTVRQWERLLRGRDLFEEFIRVAKRRLILKAISKGARWRGNTAPDADELFPGLCQGNALDSSASDAGFTVVMNPPFAMVNAPNECTWSSGHVSLAAVLFANCLERAAASTRIIAILPEVLRTGTRYQRWRDLVVERLQIARLETYGQFNCHADVDVFIVEGTVSASRGRPVAWWSTRTQTPHGIVGDFFRVSVGAVVPHRHPKKGPWAPFACSQSLPLWEKVSHIGARRRFTGATVGPPFVAIRRTSSPSDSQRAVGTIVTGRERVAVENHLLIVKPRDRRVRSCEWLLNNLQDPRTTSWLNERIRCRHLTVSVIRELPFWEGLP